MQAMAALSIKDLEPQQERRLAVAVIAIASLAIAWTLWRYVPDWLAIDDDAGYSAVSTGTEAGSGKSEESLADYALFGAAPTGGEAAPGQVVINAPETDLDLTLRGTLATREPDQALAIVGDSEDKEKAYRVGDELPGGATLHRVYRDRVIIRRAGELETLKLRDPERAVAGAGSNGARARAGTPERDPGRAGDGRELQRAAEQLRNDPAQLARNFTAVPVQENGELIGVRLRSTGEGALLSRVGLRPSDVLTSVNGIPLNDMSRAGEVMNQLQSAGSLQVTVLRNGREQQINVSLDQ